MALSCSKKLSALSRGITSKINGDFYCLNCLLSFRANNKCKSHKKVCENKDFYKAAIPYEETKISEFNQYQESDKAPFLVYADLECLIEKIDGCKNNPENSSTIKVGENIASGFGMSMISSFKSIENKHNIYRVKDSMKKVLRIFKRVRNEDNLFQKEKMKLLTNE